MSKTNTVLIIIAAIILLVVLYYFSQTIFNMLSGYGII
jgi:hypothetical protein